MALPSRATPSGSFIYTDEDDPEDSFGVDLGAGTNMEIGAIGTATAKIGFVTGDWLFYGRRVVLP